MPAVLQYNDGSSFAIEIPSQRAYPDWIVHEERIFRRVGSVTTDIYQEVLGRVVFYTGDDDVGSLPMPEVSS
mgnify:CR=1 FL=1